MSEEKRPIEIEDLYKIVYAEDPQISPDGRWVAFVRTQPDKMENGYKRTIWLYPTEGGDPLQLTRGGKDSNPRWSPDGKTLAFVSARNDIPQIYLLPVDVPGGEARVLTSAANGAMAPVWSPDGTHVSYLAPMNADERSKEDSGEAEEPPQDQLEGKHRKERKAEDEKNRLDPYPMYRIPYRQGTSMRGDRFTQIYVMPVAEGLEGDEAKPKRLTNTDVDHSAGQWSMDGQWLYFARAIDPEADEPFRQSAVYRVSVEGGEPERLTEDGYACFAPLPSPDGKTVAFVRSPNENGSLTEALTRLSVMPVDGGDVRDLNLEVDRAVASYEWTPAGDALVCSVLDRGDGYLARFDTASGEVTQLLAGTFKAGSVDVGPNGEIAYTASTPTMPPELCWLPDADAGFNVVTSLNEKLLVEVIVQETHEMWFKNPQGEDVQGWYILPVGYEEGKQYPLALNIHGGPHVMWGPSEHTMFHEWQLHAASGYVVFYCNPRGGDGYGEAFQKALHAAWGEVAYDDIMAGVDTLLKKGFVDEQRMVVTGGSYGGYMTAWIVGHTQRFAAAVSQRGVYNLSSFYGTSDIPMLISSEFDVEPWENPELLWQHSPLAYAHKIKTPILIIHAENDYRVPIEQAEQLFAFVRRSGGTVEMLRYPRDGHELSRSGEPKHRASRLERMVDWFDRYCK